MEIKEEVQTEQTIEEPQILTIKLPLNEWGAILSAIQQSSAPFIQVNAILNELDRQLKPQVKDDNA